MKKLLALLLALALIVSLTGCFAPSTMDVPQLPDEPPVSQAPTEEPTEEPTDVLVEFPTEEPTEEETIYDPRPHPADVDKEQEDPRPRPTEPDYSQDPQPTEPPTEAPTEAPTEPPTEAPTEEETKPSGSYYNTKDEVALYIHLYGCLPDNYITKDEAKRLYGGNKYIPSNMNIGGDRFYNKEGHLPSGYTYYECDVDTTGGRDRGKRRLVFTTSGIVYFTDDHYVSFTLLYGEP